MATHNLILIETLCLHYKIEVSFFDTLESIGLIEIKTIKENKYLYQDKIGDVEKMIRLHHELNINMEGIDIVFNLLENEIKLKDEINKLKNKLRIYEDD